MGRFGSRAVLVVSPFLVTVVIFTHLNRSFYLLTYFVVVTFMCVNDSVSFYKECSLAHIC